MNTLVDHFNGFTVHFPTTTLHRNESSESLCLCNALSREGEEEHAYDLACTSMGQPVLPLTPLRAGDK